MSASRRQLVLGGVLAALILSGCATTSPFNQDFVEVRTPNFRVMSSHGEPAALELARSLEFFHAGVLYALGLEGAPTSAPPTEVLAFDDRSLARPFAVRGASSALLPEIDRMILVLRAGRSFGERASFDLRHRYAHRVLRDRSRSPRPLWYEEGVAQMSSTIDERPTGIRVGAMVDEYRRQLLDWRRSDLGAKLRVADVSEKTDLERRLFEAQVWAIAHTLRFAGGAATAQESQLEAYRRALDSDDAWQRNHALEAISNSDEELSRRVYAHLESKRVQVRLIQVQGWDASKLEVRPLSKAESRSRLGDLALRLDRPGLAEDYFERALRDEPSYPPALVGRVLATAGDSGTDEFERAADEVLAAAESDADAHRRIAEAYVIAAGQASSPVQRTARIGEARRHYARALEIEPRDVRARVGMGETFLLDRADGEGAIEWFESAKAQRPGALGIDLAIAEFELQQGNARAAEVRAAEVLSRTHSPELSRRARALLDRASGGR